MPSEWQWQAKSQTRKQLTILKKLVKQASQLVHAGDPDREGQLLVDEIIHYCKVSSAKQKTVKRLLVNDLTPNAVKKALSQIKPNSDFAALSRSALARARADWLFGLNLTRAYTIKGRQAGYQGVLSIGRVQTPVLGLVVQRDKDIEEFEPKDFYQVLAHIITPEQQSFIARWQPSEACQPYMDEENRVLSKALANNVVQRINQQAARVTQADYKNKRQAPPLPFSLSALQIDAAKAFSMSAQQVLDSCQSLYEKHQLITYPRSDSRHLPVEQLNDAANILASLDSNLPSWHEQIQQANLKQKSKAWNDKKVLAHHAIIPTAKRLPIDKLTANEGKLYNMIARQYLMQFYPDYEYLAAHIELTIAGGHFIAKGKTPLKLGWKSLFPNKKGTIDQDDDSGTDKLSPLPVVQVGAELLCERGQLEEKVTTPPAAFYDATLLAAMTGINRYVTDQDIKAILKETDGLGTEATRAGIIELLFKRGFLIRSGGKNITSTPTGKALINCLPKQVVTPDMTAQWESSLNKISLDEMPYQGFMSQLEDNLIGLIQQAKIMPTTALKALPAVAVSKKTNFRKKRTASKKPATTRKAKTPSKKVTQN